jgi:hypothetical protein
MYKKKDRKSEKLWKNAVRKTAIQAFGILRSNRLNFDRELEENLYRDAEKSGDIKWLYKGEKSIEKESIK